MSVQPVAGDQTARAAFLIQREVARIADSDDFFDRAEGMGQELNDARLETHQVRSLENLACATTMVTDIYDFVKRQVGRKKWRLEPGTRLLDALQGLRDHARRIAESVRAQCPEAVDADTARQIHLALCREFLKHVVAHYLYLEREARP